MATKDVCSEQWLFSKISEGSEDAFGLAFEHYYPRMLSFAGSLLKSSYAAEEVIQESFIKLWENRDLLKSVQKPDDYIFIIVRNYALNYLRKMTAEQKQRDALWDKLKNQTYHVVQPLEAEETESLLRKIVAQLSPQRQKVFRLSRDMGLSPQEIANQLNLSKNTVKNHLVESLRIFKLYFRRSGILILTFFYLLINQL